MNKVNIYVAKPHDSDILGRTWNVVKVRHHLPSYEKARELATEKVEFQGFGRRALAETIASLMNLAFNEGREYARQR